MKRLVYELRGRTSGDQWMIVGIDPTKPNSKPLVSIFFSTTEDILGVLEGLNGRSFQTGGLS